MTPWRKWDSEREQKVLDDVACDLVALIQYLLADLILMCGSMARSGPSFC
jgi:hypothetical protein